MAEKRIALVTGANRGIGLEVCRQLAERGFIVLLTAREGAKATAAANKLKKAGTVEPIALDVADPRCIERAANEVLKRYDYLDVLINNAGINYDTWETVENAKKDRWPRNGDDHHEPIGSVARRPSLPAVAPEES